MLSSPPHYLSRHAWLGFINGHLATKLLLWQCDTRLQQPPKLHISLNMTDKLPPNLLALFAARPPLRYLPPNDIPPEARKTANIDGVAQYLPQLKEEFGDYKPTESWVEMKDRTRLEKEAHQKWLMGEGFKQLYNPKEDKNIRGDPYRTLFVSRLSYDTEVKDLEREFSRFGPLERVRLPVNTGESNPKKKGKPLGYAFIVYERERDMKGKPSPAFTDDPQRLW